MMGSQDVLMGFVSLVHLMGLMCLKGIVGLVGLVGLLSLIGWVGLECLVSLVGIFFLFDQIQKYFQMELLSFMTHKNLMIPKPLVVISNGSRDFNDLGIL